MAFEIDVPWLEIDDLRRRAEDFLRQKHPGGELPVPVELIVERMGIDIVPVPDFRRLMDLEACTSADLSTIRVDKYVYEQIDRRYRYTLAHELGHMVLHPQIFAELREDIHAQDAWIELIRGIPANIQSRLEWQAYTFAGLFLVPTKPLLARYEAVIPGVRADVRRAKAKGIRRTAWAEPAWCNLCELVAEPFNVSSQVIQKRLDSEGRSSKDL